MLCASKCLFSQDFLVLYSHVAFCLTPASLGDCGALGRCFPQAVCTKEKTQVEPWPTSQTNTHALLPVIPGDATDVMALGCDPPPVDTDPCACNAHPYWFTHDAGKSRLVELFRGDVPLVTIDGPVFQTTNATLRSGSVLMVMTFFPFPMFSCRYSQLLSRLPLLQKTVCGVMRRVYVFFWAGYDKLMDFPSMRVKYKASMSGGPLGGWSSA